MEYFCLKLNLMGDLIMINLSMSFGLGVLCIVVAIYFFIALLKTHRFIKIMSFDDFSRMHIRAVCSGVLCIVLQIFWVISLIKGF